LLRQETRKSFLKWCLQCGFEPALHHRLVISELEKIVAGENDRLIILMPPGSAKSTYTSKLFPPWFLAQRPNLTILACSHSGELATTFGRSARNFAEGNERWLGYRLDKASRAADEWAASNGGQFFCAGVGAGLSGRRADLGLIDDFVGKEEEVASKSFNDKVWDWYLNDFVPRLKPGAARVIIANHRNEDDLVGRLMKNEPTKWRIIKLRLLIETQEQADSDPLGRKVGEYLWPEYFTKELVTERMANPRSSGIEQQEPSPEKGGFFQKEWFDNNEYHSPKDVETGHFYGASDHAISEAQRADLSCLGLGVLRDGLLYVHYDLAWDKMGSEKQVAEWLRLGGTYKPLNWWAEKGHISKSLLPFLTIQMHEKKVYFTITPISPTADKMTRAQSAKAMMSMGLIKWPAFAPWYQRAKRELLLFPNGAHDDFVDFLAHLGAGVHMMANMKAKKVEFANEPTSGFNITPRLIKEERTRNLRIRSMLDR